MHVSHGRTPGTATRQGTGTFSGDVHLDPVLSAPGVMVNNVTFTPGGRTYWHRHPGGQLLVVTAGRGVIATRDGEVEELTSGDVVWADPDEEHWHGATGETLLAHLAVSHGTTDWGGEVSEQDYTAATS
jgi:quercetin dioxygenase-like cupin family protein